MSIPTADIGVFRILIPEQLAQIKTQASQLKHFCDLAKASVVRFTTESCPNYFDLQRQQIEAQIADNFNGPQDWDILNFLLAHMRQDLVNETYGIIHQYRSNLDWIITSAKECRWKLEELLNVYQSEHRFDKRSSKFLSILRPFEEYASQLLSELAVIYDNLQVNIPDSQFQQVSQIIRQVIMDSGPPQEYANHFDNLQKINILLNPEIYKTDDFLRQVKELKWSLIKLCLVIIQQPPSIVPIDRSRPFSVKLLNLVESVLPTNFVIKVGLVSETTAKDIILNDQIPEYIVSVLREDQLDAAGCGGSRARNSNPYLGTIFLDGTGSCGGSHIDEDEVLASPSAAKRARSKENEESWVHARGYPVQSLEGTWESYKPECCCFERKLVVKDKPTKRYGQIQRATDKFVLLAMMDVTFGTEIRQVWTLSLPFCLATNSSQYPKGWKAMVWSEAVAPVNTGTRVDFGVGENEDQAPWRAVKNVFSETFKFMMEQPMKESDLEFVREKIGEIHSPQEEITNETSVLKSQVFNDVKGEKNTSLFYWFVESLSIVQKGHLHDIYVNGMIAGFISVRKCFELLNAGVKDGTAESGSFMIRFSDTSPGGLTFVFLSANETNPGEMVVTRWKPLEIKDTDSIAEVVVKHLSLKVDENGKGPDAFQTLFPGKIDKKVVFKEFYDKMNKSNTGQDKRTNSWWNQLCYVTGSSDDGVPKLSLKELSIKLRKLLNF